MLRFSISESVRKFLTLSTLCLVPVSMHAATLFSETFETATLGFGVTTAGQFTTTGGTNVDVLGPGNGYGYECLAPESGNCVDLGGTPNNAAALGNLVSTLISIPSAGTYYLSFDLVGNSVELTTSTSATVTFGTYSQSFVLTPQDTVDGIVNSAPVVFASGGSFALSFVNTTSSSDFANGPILDNVFVTTTMLTPEPATALLLGSALLAASLIRKRAVR